MNHITIIATVYLLNSSMPIGNSISSLPVFGFQAKFVLKQTKLQTLNKELIRA